MEIFGETPTVEESLLKAFIGGWQVATSWHHVKCWVEYFQPVYDNVKKFEIRLNDRNYQVGDFLVLKEWNRHGEFYTGRVAIRKITYITEYEQKPKYVVMGIELLV